MRGYDGLKVEYLKWNQSSKKTAKAERIITDIRFRSDLTYGENVALRIESSTTEHEFYDVN